MLLYGCLYIGVSGPLIQYLKTFKKFSLGVALSSLRPWYHALFLQWMYRNGEAHTAFGRVL